MPVYVDDMRVPARGMIMCHLIADSEEELHLMADTIGVQRKWHQAPPRHTSHYDISLGCRQRAIRAGAIQITMRQAAAMTARRRETGSLGPVHESEAWLREHHATRRAAEERFANCQDLFE